MSSSLSEVILDKTITIGECCSIMVKSLGFTGMNCVLSYYGDVIRLRIMKYVCNMPLRCYQAGDLSLLFKENLFTIVILLLLNFKQCVWQL